MQFGLLNFETGPLHFDHVTWQMDEKSSLLNPFAKQTSQVVFFMCFFVNNQFRILLEQTQTGSADLETVFERNLKRIGRMVAILDAWTIEATISWARDG